MSEKDLNAAIAANSQFWKYGTGLPFNLKGTNHYPNVSVAAVTVSGMDIYVVGGIDDLSGYRGPRSGGSLTTYWKNGTLKPLDDSAVLGGGAEGIAIQVIGSDVYIAGGSNNGWAYWKNGIRNPLNGLVISGITVEGNDIYVSGSGPSFGISSLVKYFNNGIAVELSSNSGSETSAGISVIDNNVYVSGNGLHLYT